MTARNGTVRQRRFRRPLLVMEIEIKDPDGILAYWIFQGANGARGLLCAVGWPLDCPQRVVVRLGLPQHFHQHTVHYADCQVNPPGGSDERWILPEPPDPIGEGEIPFQEGDRVAYMTPERAARRPPRRPQRAASRRARPGRARSR